MATPPVENGEDVKEGEDRAASLPPPRVRANHETSLARRAYTIAGDVAITYGSALPLPASPVARGVAAACGMYQQQTGAYGHDLRRNVGRLCAEGATGLPHPH